MDKKRSLARKAILGSLGLSIVIVLGLFFLGFESSEHVFVPPTSRLEVTKEEIAESLRGPALRKQFPSKMGIATLGEGENLYEVKYSFDQELQNSMEKILRAYDPDYGAFVALDARTGRVLSLVSYSKYRMKKHLALKATFPSASVFKVVTAAAAIGEQKVSPETIVPFNGRDHTLYRQNVLHTKKTRWTRFMTLREAFARSVNTVFGKLGAFYVGPEDLRSYADRFGFNRPVFSDLPIETAQALIPDDPWGLAESASGFTRENKMSPIQGAMIAASIANEGVMMEPFVVESLYDELGEKVYTAVPRVAGIPVDSATAAQVRVLMGETVHGGTSRGSFRGFFRKDFAGLDVGGKTGSLTGMDPYGKCDWFVGYADSGPDRIAVAALTVNRKYWTIRSSYLARKAFEVYFKDVLSTESIASR